jgi:ComF family protein
LHLPRIQGWICAFCGTPLKDGGNCCFTCRRSPSKILIRAATVYQGAIRNAIHRYKYAGRKGLGIPLATLLYGAWTRWPELRPIDALVPVPLHRTSYRQRGYNQAEILAQSLSQRTSIPVLAKGLVRIRKTKPQFELTKEDRLSNLAGALEFESAEDRPLKGMNFLLIDDVCTTGATLIECARALRQAGAPRVKALVVAKDI